MFSPWPKPLFCLSSLLIVLPLTAQPAEVHLNRSLVGTVSGSGEVALKFDYSSSAAEQTYPITTGATNVFPVAGRWRPDTADGVGFYRRSDDSFHLRPAQTAGAPTTTFRFFPASPPAGVLYPLMGDWDGDGIDTAGIYNRSTKTLHYKNLNAFLAPITAVAIAVSDSNRWRPVAGDWDGDGDTDFGLFHTSQGRLRRYVGLPVPTVDEIPLPAPPAGGPLWPIAGDWNHDGAETLGVFATATKTFYLLDPPGGGPSWDQVFVVADADGRPVAGSWDGVSFRYAVPPTVHGLQPRTFPQLISRGGGAFDLYFSGMGTEPAYIDSLFFNSYSAGNLYDNAGWQLPVSVELQMNTGATALGVVLSDDSPVFRHPTGTLYRQLIFYVIEHEEPIPPAGWVCLTYSNGAGQWTPPIYATTDPANTSPALCDDFLAAVPMEIFAEQVSGFRDGSRLLLAVMEGDSTALGQAAQDRSSRTLTDLYTADVDRPWLLVRRGEFSSLGMDTPNTGGRWVHNFGINLDFTYDPVERAFYWSRSYPYPFDVEAEETPCVVDGCPQGLALNPNRTQTYTLPLLPGETIQAAIPRLFTGTWTLVRDQGSSGGYPSGDGISCSVTPLISPIQDGSLGIDANMMTFVKDENGHIFRDQDGKRSHLFGGAAVKDRTLGECAFSERSIFIWREP